MAHNGFDMRRCVITGMGAVSSLGPGVDSLLTSLREGISGIGALPASHAYVSNSSIGALLPELSLERELKRYGTSDEQEERIYACTKGGSDGLRAAVIAVLEAWRQAQLDEHPLDPERIGIIVAGSNIATRLQYQAYERYGDRPEYLSPRYALQYLDTNHVGVISDIFRLHGEGISVGGASASGNAALIKGLQAIRYGLMDACVVVGAMADLSRLELQGFYNSGAMAGARFLDAPSQACRPFDMDREGFVYGQAAACIVLESRHSAQRRNVEPLAEILGGTLRLDGNHLANPSRDGEAQVMRQALADAGVDASQVDYLNAHGTASVLGDETEVQAIKDVFAPTLDRLWINSTKSLIGHCLYSASVMEGIATVLQMREGFVHPNLNLQRPLDADCRFCGAASMPADVQVAVSNGFGFGGINTSIVFSKGKLT